MRFFLKLLTIVALLMAPLAVPAAAMAAAVGTVECADMAMSAPDHPMPAGEHEPGKPCCIAVPPAIDPPLTGLQVAVFTDHLAFVAGIEPFRLGAGPKAEDPPPRTA